jgi:hypothetical protein
MTTEAAKIQYSQAVDIERNEKAMEKAQIYFNLAKQAHERLNKIGANIEMYDKLQFYNIVITERKKYNVTLAAYNRCLNRYKQTLFKIITAKVPEN